MNRQFVFHLDALLMLSLLFCIAIGMNLVQYQAYSDLVKENYSLQLQGLEDKFNLDSSRQFIDQLQAEKIAAPVAKLSCP